MATFLRYLLFAVIASPIAVTAQVVTTDPAIVQSDSRDVVVTFHANRGNGGLANLTSDDAVYAHTGVITSGSSGGGDWKYSSSWGDNSPKYRLLYVSDDTWELIIPSIQEY